MVMIGLELCACYSSSCHHHLHHTQLPIKSRVETFWYRLIKVHLENSRYSRQSHPVTSLKLLLLIHRGHKDVSQMVLTITLKVVNDFPSHFARSINDKCLTVWHRNYPLHLTYVCTLLCKVIRVKIVTKHKCTFRLLLAKNFWIKTKIIFSLT